MELIDGFYEALTGAPTDAGRSVDQLIVRLAAVAGSGSAAARQLGVSHTSFNRWLRGVQRPKTGANVIRAAIRRTLLDPGREADIRSGRRRLVITALVRVSNDLRRRVLRVGDHIPKPVMSRIVTTWLSGNDDQTDRRLWNAMDRYYLGGMTFERLESVDFR